MPKRTPEEILKSIEEAAVDDEIARVLAMNDEERRAELRAAGFDIDEIHAEADAFHAKLIGSPAKTGATPPQKAVAAHPIRATRPSRPTPAVLATRTARTTPAAGPLPRPRTLFLLAAALSAAVSVAVSIPTALVVAQRVATPAAAPVVAPPAASQRELVPAADVADLRRKSLEACEDARWVECLYGLDRARHADPAGDADPLVLLARREAAAGLRHEVRPRELDAK
jgi:hypothetical protein